MVARDLRVTVLAEDTTHHNFVRQWLRAEGVDTKHRFIAVPAGVGGAGEKHVRERFADEVTYYRQKANSQRIGLVVVIDADAETVARRRVQLAEQLKTAGIGPCAAGERIAILVPRRNVETWLTFFDGSDSVDEETDYKRPHAPPSHCREAGSAFADLLNREPRPGDLPSLVAAREEAARLR